jgi:hypothetical protein
VEDNHIGLVGRVEFTHAHRVKVAESALRAALPRKKPHRHFSRRDNVAAGLRHHQEVGQMAGQPEETAGDVLVRIVDVRGPEDLREGEHISKPVQHFRVGLSVSLAYSGCVLRQPVYK